MKPSAYSSFHARSKFRSIGPRSAPRSEAIVLMAQSVADALQIVCQRGRELDFALMDFDGGCRGMTLLSAVHTCYPQLPILVTTSKNATTYNRCCLRERGQSLSQQAVAAGKTRQRHHGLTRNARPVGRCLKGKIDNNNQQHFKI